MAHTLDVRQCSALHYIVHCDMEERCSGTFDMNSCSWTVRAPEVIKAEMHNVIRLNPSLPI